MFKTILHYQIPLAIITVVLCIITYNQITLTKALNEPFFSVSIDAVRDNSGFYSTKYLRIENSGGEARGIHVDKKQYYVVTYTEDLKSHGPFYIPAIFYFASYKPNLSKGLVYESFTPNNNLTLYNFNMSLRNLDRFYIVEAVVFTSISYTTIFGDKKTLYFYNEELLNALPPEVAGKSQIMAIDIDKLSLELMEKYIEEKNYITIGN